MKFTTKHFTGQKNSPQPDDADADYVPIDIDFPVANFTAGDIIELIHIPPGVRLVDWFALFPDVDTGTAAFTFSIGILNADSTDLQAVFSAGHTAGRDNTLARATTTDAYFYDSSFERKLGMKVTAAAATYTAPTVPGTIFISLRG